MEALNLHFIDFAVINLVQSTLKCVKYDGATYTKCCQQIDFRPELLNQNQFLTIGFADSVHSCFFPNILLTHIMLTIRNGVRQNSFKSHSLLSVGSWIGFDAENILFSGLGNSSKLVTIYSNYLPFRESASSCLFNCGSF